MKKKKIFIVYFSPAGSTRHVVKIIEKQFQGLGAEVFSFDLAECSNDVATEISQQMEASNGNSCLFIGSPVYVSHAVPIVMECIAGLKENADAFAVPFVTWGGACSGISLYEMGKELINKRFTLLGTAKILALHSLMWQLEDPLGKGHPDAVTFTPYPEFGGDCVFCFNCMKKCPEKAINADLSEIWQRIRDRAAFFSERPYSQIFF